MQCLGFESSNRAPARRPKEVWNQTRRAVEHIFARHAVRKYVPAQPSRPGGTISRPPWDVRQCTARCLQGWTALLTKSSTVHMKTGRGRTTPRGSAGTVARTQCSEKLAGMLAVWYSLVHSGNAKVPSELASLQASRSRFRAAEATPQGAGCTSGSGAPSGPLTVCRLAGRGA